MHFLLLILLLPFNAWAQWPDKVLAVISTQTPLARHIENPAVATFWGGFRRFRSWNSNTGELQTLPSPLFKNKEFTIYLSKQKHKAPLFVFLPGIYGQPKQGLTPQMINVLENLGGHVLVVPNLLSPSYISSHPLYKEDPIALEIQVMEQALDFAQAQIKDDVSQIYVVAESLGTAIASAWVAYDTQHKKRVHDLTLLWPPMDLSFAMKNFDAIIDEHRPSIESCSIITKLWAIGREFILQEYPSTLSKDEEFCLGGLVLVDGFVTATQRSWAAHNEIVKSNLVEPVGFEDFFRKYRPELWKLLERRDERLRLEHWLKVIRLAPDFHLRIMTSENDFLNRGLDWKKLKEEFKLSNNELVILPWGGHSGPIGMSIFPQILKWTFSEADGKSYSSH